jgi:diguanylate cyclase (GGDEF)-like protein
VPIPQAAAGPQEKADATAHSDLQERGERPTDNRGTSVEVKATAAVAVVLAVACLAMTRWTADGPTWLPPAVFVVTLGVIVALYHFAVFRPITFLISRARQRLGENYERSDPRYRSETRELSHLVGLLIAVFRASEDKDCLLEDLSRAQALNRQLMDVGQLGKEMNAALPYRETVERVLTSTRAFLRADFVALLLLDDEARVFSLEGAQGILAPGLSADCCASTPDCPVRRAIASESLVRLAGHACSLFPQTMTHQVVIPVPAENIGRMALLTTATSGDYVQLLTDDILTALQNHVQSALANAHKYDAIRRQVVTDHLTHLYNRRFFANRAREEIERTLRHKSPLSVLMVDIDNFKLFNDVHGHATGDRVLQTVARAMQAALRTSDVCARYGGEEFAMLLPNTSGENAYYVAERVRKTLQSTRYTGLGLPADVNITISVGVATCPRDATSFDELLRLADEALYAAKREGRDRVVLYGSSRRECASLAP